MSDTHIDVCKGGHSPEERRAFTDILAHIGDKWTVLVVGVLSLGPMRYSQATDNGSALGPPGSPSRLRSIHDKVLMPCLRFLSRDLRASAIGRSVASCT